MFKTLILILNFTIARAAWLNFPVKSSLDNAPYVFFSKKIHHTHLSSTEFYVLKITYVEVDLSSSYSLTHIHMLTQTGTHTYVTLEPQDPSSIRGRERRNERSVSSLSHSLSHFLFNTYT